MIYMANPCTDEVRAAMRGGVIGMMATPEQGNIVDPAYEVWAADNGCFGNGYPGDAKWLEWLEEHADQAGRCLFATAPDVFTGATDGSDAAATLARSAPFFPVIRRLGYRAALVAQVGLEDVPWDDFDVLFIGGTTEWKLGPHAIRLIREAQARGKGTHVGRVNSEKRFRAFAAVGVDSVDGTYLTYGPDINLGRLLAWIRGYETQPTLFEVA